MDNTDGVGQSLSELSETSKCAFVIEASRLQIPDIVKEVGYLVHKAPLDFVFNGGADFSLIGTIRGEWSRDRAKEQFGPTLEIIGRIEPGRGVWIEDGERKPLTFQGWNYFQPV
jgi:thiamine monophosphate kinase